jgi:hypothetical protein
MVERLSQKSRFWAVLALASLCLFMEARARAADDAVEARMRRDITYLASDECEGRGIETAGINRAADYIASEFRKAGLKPAAGAEGYFQPFTMRGTAKLESPNTLRLRGPQGQEIELEMGRHFYPVGYSGAGKVNAPVVFVAYGISAKNVPYDDYKDLDVAGKVVLIVRKTPRSDSKYARFDGDRMMQHAALSTKLVQANLHKAAAVLFVSDRRSAAGGDSLDLMGSFKVMAAGGGAPELPAVQLRRAVADEMLESALGTSLAEVEKNIDVDLKPRGASLKGWTADLEVNVRRPTLPVKNVVGVLEGAGPLANETEVLGAHYDHLGYGGPYSLARNQFDPAIHHGADDNASGTTALIELARRFGAQRERQGRRLVFMAFSGEESGLIGSEYYVNHPLFPLKDTAVMLNMDMVGRLATPQDNKNRQVDQLIVYGTGTSKGFDHLIDDLNGKYHFKLKKVPTGFGPSDNSSFYSKKVPVFFFFTGDHPDYHRPSDTADKINVPGMRRVTDLVEDVATRMDQAGDRPQYIAVAGSMSPGMSIPRIGIRPSYGDTGEGVLLGGVTPGGAADRAGLKEGDRIVAVAGKPVKNLESYMVLMSRQKKGEPIELGVLRSGKTITVRVKPE